MGAREIKWGGLRQVRLSERVWGSLNIGEKIFWEQKLGNLYRTIWECCLTWRQQYWKINILTCWETHRMTDLVMSIKVIQVDSTSQVKLEVAKKTSNDEQQCEIRNKDIWGWEIVQRLGVGRRCRFVWRVWVCFLHSGAIITRYYESWDHKNCINSFDMFQNSNAKKKLDRPTKVFNPIWFPFNSTIFPRHSSRQFLSKFIAKQCFTNVFHSAQSPAQKQFRYEKKNAFVSAKQLIKGKRQFMSFRHFFFEFEMEISTISSRNTSKCFRRWNFYYLFLQHKLLMPFFFFIFGKKLFSH